MLLDTISKIGFWFKVKAEPMFNPQTYLSIPKSWNEAPTPRLIRLRRIGPKDIFEIASISYLPD